MKILPEGAELFHAHGQADVRTWWSQQSLFAITWMRFRRCTRECIGSCTRFLPGRYLDCNDQL